MQYGGLWATTTTTTTEFGNDLENFLPFRNAKAKQETQRLKSPEIVMQYSVVLLVFN